MRNKTLIFLVIWGVLSSGAAVYYWKTSQRLIETNRILNESNALHKQLVENEYKSYQAINDCFVVNRGLCNPEEFKSRLQALGDEADEFYKQIEIFGRQLQLLRK